MVPHRRGLCLPPTVRLRWPNLAAGAGQRSHGGRLGAECARLIGMFAVPLVARLHVDLQRVVSAACPAY